MAMMLGRHNSSEWKTVIQELTLHKEEVERLREELDDVKLHFKHEMEALKDQVHNILKFSASPPLLRKCNCCLLKKITVVI